MSILLMIVLVIDYAGVAFHEFESYPPIAGYFNTPISFQFAVQLMLI
jgi:hypothetical protein